MNEPKSELWLQTTEREQAQRREFYRLFQNSPIPAEEQLNNLGLFMKRQDLSRLLFKNDLYRQILDVHGIVMEFGVRWGQTLALFQSFRGIYESFNYSRKVVGFDTFEGFPSVDEKDLSTGQNRVGAFATTACYETFLEQVLAYHEQESPLQHIKKYELVKGDASVEIGHYLERNPETIIALAYFDLDLYEPTKRCLVAIRDRLTKGSIVAFDELNAHYFPGETLALKEALGLSTYRIRRCPYSSLASYLVIE